MASSKLQDKVARVLFSEYAWLTIKENHRPQWLINDDGQRLELDFYIEDFDIGVEVQGRQHAVYTPHFHGDYAGFADQLKRDRDKKRLCENAGVRLIEVYASSEIRWIREAVNDCLSSAPEDNPARHRLKLLVLCRYAKRLAKFVHNEAHPTETYAEQMAGAVSRRIEKHGFRAISPDELVAFTVALFPEPRQSYPSHIKTYRRLIGIKHLPYRDEQGKRKAHVLPAIPESSIDQSIAGR